MEQLFFFSDLPALDQEQLEGRIDPHLDAAFLAEIARAFEALPDAERADADAA